MSSFTPGPWAVREGFRDGDWEVYPTRGGPPDFGDWADLANVTGDYGDDGGDEGRANAHLIAAAPDLLAVAKECIDLVKLAESLCGCRGDDDYVWGIQERLNAAIAKAEGRS